MRNPIKIAGGKYLIKKWIIDNFPPHDCYLEGFLGGGSILYNKPKCDTEFAIDTNYDIINFNNVVKDNFVDFYNIISNIEYNDINFEWAKNYKECDDVTRAAKYLIRNRFSRDGNLEYYAWSDRLRRGKPEQMSSWETIIKELPLLQERIAHVNFFGECLLFDFNQFDASDVFMYLDPPYLPEVRTKGLYKDFEQDKDFHIRLLCKCIDSKAKIMISGYDHPLYNSILYKWRKLYKNVSINIGSAKSKGRREEVIWMNY